MIVRLRKFALCFTRSVIFFFCLFSAINSFATVLITQPAPYPTHKMGDTGIQLYLGGSKSGLPFDDGVTGGGIVNPNFRFLPTNAGDVTLQQSGNLILLDIKSDKSFNAGSGYLMVTLSTTSDGNAAGIIYLSGGGTPSGAETPALCSGGAVCYGNNGTGFYKSVGYSSGSTLRVAFSLDKLCAATASQGTLCTSDDYKDIIGLMLSQNIYATFGVMATANGLDSGGGNGVSGGTIDTGSATLNVTDIPPRLSGTCPSLANYYFPGDGEINVRVSNFGANVGSGTGGVGGAPATNLVFMAKQGVSVNHLIVGNTSALNTNDVVGYLSTADSSKFIKGFKNLEAYQAIVYAQNAAGIISANTASTGYCEAAGVKAQPISGVLKESKCFIATAAFHDGRAAPVMMLRKFRDQILAKTEMGRSFIEKYYRYSPALAEWAWDKPLIRSIALKFLAPVELAAWTMLQISGVIESAQAEEPAVESYIDKLKRRLKEQDAKRGIVTDGPKESYSEQQKKLLDPTPAPSESYIESQKRDLPETTSPANYSETQKTLLPPEKLRESPIKLVKDGRDKQPGLGEMPPIKNAMGFRVGVDPGIEVEGGGEKFSDVYGVDWKPDIWIHYERQLFHSENLGSFGLGIDTGVSFAGGYGRLAVDFNGTRKSETPFSFLQIPLIVSGTYRFNLLRILRPYARAGLGTMLYTELRKDDKPDKRGYSFIYDTAVGVCLLLDFLDTYTSRNSYVTDRIQNTYLFAEYEYLGTITTDVRFKRSGIYSGFLFEF